MESKNNVLEAHKRYAQKPYDLNQAPVETLLCSEIEITTWSRWVNLSIKCRGIGSY